MTILNLTNSDFKSLFGSDTPGGCHDSGRVHLGD